MVEINENIFIIYWVRSPVESSKISFYRYCAFFKSTLTTYIGVMDIFHAVIVPKAIYCLYLQGINAMNQKTALFVVTNTSRKMDASSANNSTNA